ncbi:MAG TPA: molybdopterin cofactor-binding domain-containing protein [Candidatus Acidoferrales bacterium]|nr:molybdopterin cofactor-binding domain-containing protein [Candidatus Acidoferrales bacterium]
MSESRMTPIVIEPERYELNAPPVHFFEMDRRGFMKALGGGIAVLLVAKNSPALQESGRRGGMREEMPREISAWLHIAEDGGITVFTGKVEIGQNIKTSLAQTVADELHTPLASISMVMGDTKLTPFDMGTFGSRSTPQMGTQLRRVAWATRDVLTQLAAKQWNADAKQLVAEDGKIADHVGGRTISYGELARGQALAAMIPEEDPVTPATEWKIAGQAIGKLGARDFVTGRHKYTPDLKLPGMLYGKILRPAAFGATLASVDLSAAKAMPGVVTVHDGDFVGVAAPDELTAERALAAIKAEWKTPPPQTSSHDLFDYLKKNAQTDPAEENRYRQTKGSMSDALAAAAHRVEATYTVAYIQHSPLEPRAALAEWQDGKLNAWTGSQRPFGVRDELMQAFHLTSDQVRVVVPDTGAAYGGKHTGEAAIEAARLAQAAGKPVHLLWTREEELTWAYFRPAGVIEIKSGVSADGTLTAWEFHNYNSGAAGIGTPYEVANHVIEFHPVEEPPLRQGSYRALAATANHFARESHMDELTHAAGIDPLEFRMKNLKDERLRAVYEAAAKQFGWDPKRKNAAGHGCGIAGGIEKGGHIATCVEVEVDSATREVRVLRVVAAFDCGAIVNPDGLKNQIAGGNMMGIGGALYEAIEFENGRVTNARFSQYRVPRFSEMPRIEVVLVDRKEQPSFGAGETPIVGLAPAVANAIFDAIGVRIRSMPMLPGGKLPASA